MTCESKNIPSSSCKNEKLLWQTELQKLGREKPLARLQKKKGECDTLGEHSFLTDVIDVRKMEEGLLQLLKDFHSGRLEAFGQDSTMQQMEEIKDKQRELAKLHFDLASQQEEYPPMSEQAQQMAADHLQQLVKKLQELSVSIEKLHTSSGQNYNYNDNTIVPK